MSLASKVGRLVGHYRGSAPCYDSVGQRLIDQSGNGMHLPLLAGTPTFAPYSGSTGLIMRGDTYWGCPIIDTVPVVPQPTKCTLVAVVWPKILGSDVYPFVQSAERVYAYNGDPAWQAPTDAYGAAGTSTVQPLLEALGSGNANNVRAGTPSFAASTVYNPGAWNVVQGVFDPDIPQMQIRKDNDAFTVIPIQTGYSLAAMDDWRLGYKATPVVTTGGGDFAFAQLMIFNGNMPAENPTDYAALIAALVANPTA